MKRPLATDACRVDSSSSSSADTLFDRAHADEAGGGERICFSVHADADPGLISRVIEVFALRGLVPSRCHGVRNGPSGEELHFDLQFDDLSPREAETIAEKLRQLWLVHNVLTSTKQSVDD